MRLDRQSEAFLAAGRDNPPLHEAGLEAARAAYAAGLRAAGGAMTDVGSIEARTIAGPAGPIPVRLYWPVKRAAAKNLPILAYFHGGGFALGDAETYDGVCRSLCASGEAVVVNVDYRRSPENKFPAAPEDCYAALCWAAREASALGGRADGIAVAGDSAGGNLAAAVSQMARDRNGPHIAYQILIYPVVEMDAANCEAPSRVLFGGGEYLASRKDMAWLTDLYIQSPSDFENPYLSPIRASDLTRLPPALVITAGFDPLCDEGKTYADLLAAAGVATEHKCYENTIHGFVTFSGAIDLGKDALALIGERLKARLA